MNVTTVKLYPGTKTALDGLRSEKETYDDVIGRLILQTKNKNLKSELIEAYRDQDRKDLKILEEWDTASPELEND